MPPCLVVFRVAFFSVPQLVPFFPGPIVYVPLKYAARVRPTLTRALKPLSLFGDFLPFAAFPLRCWQSSRGGCLFAEQSVAFRGVGHIGQLSDTDWLFLWHKVRMQNNSWAMYWQKWFNLMQIQLEGASIKIFHIACAFKKEVLQKCTWTSQYRGSWSQYLCIKYHSPCYLLVVSRCKSGEREWVQGKSQVTALPNVANPLMRR